jgi:hypothetical protein
VSLINARSVVEGPDSRLISSAEPRVSPVSDQSVLVLQIEQHRERLSDLREHHFTNIAQRLGNPLGRDCPDVLALSCGVDVQAAIRVRDHLLICRDPRKCR